MKKIKNIVQLFMTLVLTITSVFGNAFAVYADANPDAGKVTATKTAERIGDETSRSAKVKITVSGNPYTVTTQKDREIVLVLDASGSMNDKIGKDETKISALKEAVETFIDSLLTEENAGKIKIGVVWYAEKKNTFASEACPLSDDAETLKVCVSSKKASEGTNVQLGISIAKDLFTDADNEKSLIVLSDGEPTLYNDANGIEHGYGSADAHEYMYAYDFVATRNYTNNRGQWVSDGYIDYYDYNSEETFRCEYVGYRNNWGQVTYESETCPAGFNMKPSEAAQKEAASFNGKIYSIGFGITSKDRWGNTITNTAAESFLKSIVKNGGRYFDASDSVRLNEAFAAVSKDMDIVAKDLTIRDVVPGTFTVDKVALKEKYGDDVEIIEENNQTIIIYKFNELSSKKPEELEFTVTAKDDYYGSMYTNSEATVTGTASDGNKFYENVDGKISEDLINPVAPIAVKANPDHYDTNTNEELSKDEAQGVRNNDSSVKSENEVKSVLDKVRLVTDAKYGKLTLNENGSFTYNPNQNFRGNDSFTYYVETTIEDENGNKTIAKSEVTTVTITVKGVKTEYIVNYLEKGTDKVLAPSKTVYKNASNEDLYIGDKVTEYALTLDKYNLVSKNPETITLAKEGNVINFYYELKDSKIIVHYVEKDTNTKLADDDTFDGKVTETKVITAKDIKDYVVVGSNTQKAKFDLTTNEYTFLYEKAESAGAVAHHYIIDNNGNKTTDKLFNDDTASGKIGETFSFSPKTEGLGDYEFVESEGTTSGTLTSTRQEATFYYQLKETEVTVRYVTIKDGNVIDLINPVKDTGRINDNYTAYAKDENDDAIFANYDLESATEQNIQLTSGDNTISFIYTLKDSKIIVHYVEKGTNETLAPDKEFTGKVTDKFEISAINIPKYTAVDTTSYNGEYALETKEYTFYYEKNNSAGAVAHHYIIDENGNKTTDKLFEDETITGKLDDKYSFSAKNDLGAYEFVESEGKVSGILTDEMQEVTFYYQLKSAKVIVRHYEEGTTIKIADDETINGKVSKDYTTKAADIYGYTLVSTPENTSGKFTDEVIEVIYYYKKDMGKVITKYVDEDGKVLLEETTTNGQVGTDYQTSPATITDYELIKTIGEEKGKYTKEDIIVTYVYQYVMGQGGDDTPKEPEIPYTGIENDSYILEYSLMGTSALGLILLAILKKKFN